MMENSATPRRNGLSRADLLTALLTTGALTSLLIPAVERSSEAARCNLCSDHLRDVGRACLAYSEVNDSFLPSNQESPFGSWNTAILPYLGESSIHDKYDFASDWWDDAQSENRKAGARRINVFLCPSAPYPDRWVNLQDNEADVFRMAPTDYVGSAGAYLHNNLVDNLHRGALAYPGRHYGASGVAAKRAVRLVEILDGCSQTTLVVEMADKPNSWRRGTLAVDNLNPESPPVLNPEIGSGNWSAPNWNHLRSYDESGEKPFGACGVNCANGSSIYGFHPGGANVVFADGAVHFLKANLPEEIMVALVSISGGEIVAEVDYAGPQPQ